jgi:hypothetical protein
MALKDMFHGETKDAAVLSVLRANCSSPISDNSDLSPVSPFLLEALELQLFRLNCLRDSFVEDGFANSTQPLAETKPPRPTECMS